MMSVLHCPNQTNGRDDGMSFINLLWGVIEIIYVKNLVQRQVPRHPSILIGGSNVVLSTGPSMEFLIIVWTVLWSSIRVGLEPQWQLLLSLTTPLQFTHQEDFPLVSRWKMSRSMTFMFILFFPFIFILSKDKKKRAQNYGYFKVQNVLSSHKSSIQRCALTFHSSIKQLFHLVFLLLWGLRLVGWVPGVGKGVGDISAVFSLSPLCVRHTSDELGEGGENRGRTAKFLLDWSPNLA